MSDTQQTPAVKQSPHYDYIDFLNIFACFSVVLMHCTGGVFYFSISKSWFYYMFMQSIAHFAVPIFFMITGMTLLEYREKYDTKTFYKKRFLKTGIPFIVWSYVYILINHAGALPTFWESIQMLLNNKCLNIFWFFYELFALYLMIPIFSLMAKKENLKTITFFVGIFVFFSGIFPLLQRITPISTAFIPSMTTGCVGYLFCGFLIKHETFSKKVRYCIYALGTVGLGTIFFGTYILSKQQNELNTIFMDYYSIPTMLYSFGLALFAKHFPFEKIYKVMPKKVIRNLSSASFGVYLTHMILLIINENHHPLAPLGTIASTILLPLLVYGLCLLFVLLMHKIPILKKLIP